MNDNVLARRESVARAWDSSPLAAAADSLVAVGFVPDGEDDEALAMLVETTADAPPTLADDVASRVQERTQIRPTHVELLAPGTLPRTSSGKLRRREAGTQWLAGSLAPPKKATAARLLAAAAHGELSHARARFSRRAANTLSLTRSDRKQ